jgi:hypothetical protein
MEKPDREAEPEQLLPDGGIETAPGAMQTPDSSAGIFDHDYPPGGHNLFRCSHPLCRKDAEAARLGQTGHPTPAPYGS